MRQQRTAARDTSAVRWIRTVIGTVLGAALGLGVSITPAEAATCTYTGPAGGLWTVAGNWSCGVVPGATDQAIVPVAGMVVLDGDATVSSLTNSGTLTIQGTFHLGQTVTNAGIIQVNGSGESTIRRLTNNGVFNVNTGTLVAGSNNSADGGVYTVAAGATLRFGLVNGFDNGIRTFTGNMSVAGTLGFTFGGFTATAGTVTFNSGATQTLLTQAAVTFFNVTVTPGTTLVESSIVGSSTPVTGTLTNQGRIRHVLPVPLDIPNIPHFFGLTGVRIDVASAGSLSSLQVDRVAGNHPNGDATVGLGEFWTITPAGANFNLSLTLPHAVPPATASVCRFTGTTWNCRVTSSTATTVTRADITTLSDWAVGNGAPISPPDEPPPPPPTFTRYFAEGATGTFFDTTIALLNPTTEAAATTLKFLKQDGVVVTHALNIPALTRATVNPETLAGLEGASIATVIESTQPIVADRTMRWDASGYGSHAETSIASPLTTWYLAEGATTGGFNLYYLIQNPGAQAAEVEIRYLLPAPAAPVVKTYTIAANSRHSIYVNDEAPALGEAEISAVVTSKNSVPVIVERAMYRDANGQLFGAGHASAAIANPSASWFFAEGATGPFFDMFLLIANPNADAAAIEARYLLASGQVVTKTYNVAGNSRFTIGLHTQGPELESAAVSTTLTSTNGVAVLAERAMWWPSLSLVAGDWQEGHNSAGSTETGEKWALADGEDGGPFNTQTYVLIANTSAFAGQARVTVHFEDGTSGQLANPIALDANSRTTVQIGAQIPQAANRRFGIIVESLGATPAQIVVERAMYSDATINGVPVVWAAGTNVVATRIASGGSVDTVRDKP